MNSETAKNYLLDLLTIIVDEALESRKNALEAKGKEDEQFQSGRLMAYYEVVSLISQQAECFGVTMGDLGLPSIDPDKDLHC